MKRQIKMSRQIKRNRSNNRDDPNKNVCALAVANALGCEDTARYLHSAGDLIYALRKRWTVRSRLSHVKGGTVGRAREKCPQLAAAVGGHAYFIAIVPGHVLLLGNEGQTLIDTDGRSRDRRKILRFYVVYPKRGGVR